MITLRPGAEGVDFTRFYLGAQLALQHGWAFPYSRPDWVHAAQAYFHTSSTRFYYTNPPWQLWAVAPLTLLSEPAALAVWSVLLLACLGAAYWLSTGWAASRSGRLALALAATGFFPVCFAFINGQPSLVVMLGLAGAAWLIAHDRPWLAGMVLTLALFKPQAAFLVAPALLVGGWWRTATAWAATSAGAVGIAALMLGRQGLADWVQTLHDVGAESIYQRYTPQLYLPAGAAGAAEGILAAAALYAAWRWRGRLGPALTCGVLGSLLAAPYLNPQDLSVVLVAAWLTLPFFRAMWVPAAMLLLFLGVELANSAGPVLYLVPALAWLAILALAPPDLLLGVTPRVEPVPTEA